MQCLNLNRSSSRAYNYYAYIYDDTLCAKSLFSDPSFKDSQGRLKSFRTKNGLSLHRRTTIFHNFPADCIPKIICFIMHMQNLQTCHEYGPDCFYAKDKTVRWFDMASDTTVAIADTHSVPLKSTGHEKNHFTVIHFTVILTAKTNGTKLPLYIVFKGKGTHLIKQLQHITGIIIAVQFNANGWMNNGLMIDYLCNIIQQLSFHQCLLVWDAYKCHLSKDVWAETARLRLNTSVVPGGCTTVIRFFHCKNIFMHGKCTKILSQI